MIGTAYEAFINRNKTFLNVVISPGKMAEDELFDLPRGRAAFKRTRNVGSFDRMSVDRWVP
jgi:hypothetical protein